MGHNLRTDHATGEACMAYTGAQPWHTLGQPVKDAMTADDAMTQAHLNVTIRKEPLFLADGRPAGCVATLISDTNEILGTGLGLDYDSPQPSECFNFFDDLVGSGQAQYETAGMLGKGERMWLLARMPQTLEIVKGDAIESFILLSNSYDGSSSLEARYTSIRVVCQNTLHMAMRGNAVVRLRHSKNIVSRMSQAAMLLQGYQDHLGQFGDALKRLQKVKITDELLDAFEVNMFGNLEDTPEGRGRTILGSTLAKYEELLWKGKGTDIPGVAGTAYGMLNAYTEWSDYFSTVKGDQGRTGAIVFGNAAKKKTEAFETLLALVGR